MGQLTPSVPPGARSARLERSVEGAAPLRAVHAPPVLGPAPGPASGPVSGPAAEAWTARRVGVLLVLAGVYFAAAKLSLLLAVVHRSATAVWPPTGIALAALLILGYRAWPAIALGAFLANVTTSGSPAQCLGIAAGNTLEALVGAWLVNRFANGRDAFFTGKHAFRFAGLAGLVSTAVSATLGGVSLVLAGTSSWARFGQIWTTWWLGDMSGALLVAPMLILWSVPGSIQWTRPRKLEAAGLHLLLLAAGQAVFGWVRPVGPDPIFLKFLCMPVLSWIAYRFDPRTAATGGFALAVIAVTGTVRASIAAGPVVLNTSLLMVQVYLVVSAVSTLVLAAAVHERSRAERAMRGASLDLKEAMAELEAFSHAISHDLRSPIAAVLNYVIILEEDAAARLDPESVRLLRRIRASAASAGQLLDQLVKFMWAGHQDSAKKVLDMTALAREACAEVVVGSEDGSAVQFEVEDLPPAHGNPQMLGRVLHNLLSNAVKFTRGRERRRVHISGRVEAGEHIYSVVDNGMGFDPALGDAVFQPFLRPKLDRAFSGTGLGLAIAARIVRRHGGRVGAESDGSTGARFWFALPSEGTR
jgi:signal transduction histidine kinase